MQVKTIYSYLFEKRFLHCFHKALLWLYDMEIDKAQMQDKYALEGNVSSTNSSHLESSEKGRDALIDSIIQALLEQNMRLE